MKLEDVVNYMLKPWLHVKACVKSYKRRLDLFFRIDFSEKRHKDTFKKYTVIAPKIDMNSDL